MEKFKERKIIKLLKKSPEDGIKMVIDVYGSAVNTICKNILINLNSEDILMKITVAKVINNKDVITNFLGNLLTRAGGDIADKVNIILTNDTLYLEYIGHAAIGYAEEVRDLEKIALKDLKGFSVISNENEELIKIKTLKKELIFIRNNSHNDNLALAMSKVIKDFQ